MSDLPHGGVRPDSDVPPYLGGILKDVDIKIVYLEELKALAAKCCNAREFKDMVQEKYPGYSVENYPDMTVGFSSPKRHRQENCPKTHRTVFLP